MTENNQIHPLGEPHSHDRLRCTGRTIIPGLLLCGAITIGALGLESIEVALFKQAFLEALVMAILIGTSIRTVWTPKERWQPGIDLSAKFLLEMAVVLLGASISLQAVVAAGPMLIVGIAAVVILSIGVSFAASRLLGLTTKMAMLVACGNSICGNSAIAAVAPVIHADARDVASSVAFTAILGVAVVLGLPLLMPVLGLSHYGYGVLAGMTVYAVPQVLAATSPISLLSTQVGTLVKLVRVLMLGPVVVMASIVMAPHLKSDEPVFPAKLPLAKMVPWFIIGFLSMAAARSSGLIPEQLLRPLATAARFLTLVSMAALGLGVDVRVLRQVGARAIAGVTVSLALLVAMSLIFIRLLHLA